MVKIYSQQGLVPFITLLVLGLVFGGIFISLKMLNQTQTLNSNAESYSAGTNVPLYGMGLGPAHQDNSHSVTATTPPNSNIPTGHTDTRQAITTSQSSNQGCLSQSTCHYHPDWCKDQIQQGKVMCQGNPSNNVNHPDTLTHSIYHAYCNLTGLVGHHCTN